LLAKRQLVWPNGKLEKSHFQEADRMLSLTAPKLNYSILIFCLQTPFFKADLISTQYISRPFPAPFALIFSVIFGFGLECLKNFQSNYN